MSAISRDTVPPVFSTKSAAPKVSASKVTIAPF